MFKMKGVPWKKQYHIADFQTTALVYLKLIEVKTEARCACTSCTPVFHIQMVVVLAPCSRDVQSSRNSANTKT